ncbi:MAG: D-tyrosyl-tRNA(Tyr) deacylase [Phycisphaerales bacterium]|nr:D-tyrosyl-tRNA(Tyr) deacylase [Phycisphaerales bacterium]
MKAVLQRVASASVICNPEPEPGLSRSVGPGLLILASVETDDTAADRDWMADKIINLRIFSDEAGKMNRSVLDLRGEILLISNFTVSGDARKGRRPSFDRAMRPPQAKDEFDALAHAVAASGLTVRTGVFAADMQVSLINDGPVTIWLDSKAR